ncbi:hypothetical protein HPP92_012862 [Vanilla planifolia]|uniref:Uncharacterized protein n=1 Tax=Vanilla planifolia TaxID=51239 RepID=A0A835UY30_VANPL|nr:hypothetical protein HPP92_012862 [Vanilla planifolia]
MVCIRQATTDDPLRWQACNLMCLPELPMKYYFTTSFRGQQLLLRRGGLWRQDRRPRPRQDGEESSEPQSRHITSPRPSSAPTAFRYSDQAWRTRRRTPWRESGAEQIHDVEAKYYADGEDAGDMRKQPKESSNSSKFSWTPSPSSSWEEGAALGRLSWLVLVLEPLLPQKEKIPPWRTKLVMVVMENCVVSLIWQCSGTVGETQCFGSRVMEHWVPRWSLYAFNLFPILHEMEIGRKGEVVDLGAEKIKRAGKEFGGAFVALSVSFVKMRPLNWAGVSPDYLFFRRYGWSDDSLGDGTVVDRLLRRPNTDESFSISGQRKASDNP